MQNTNANATTSTTGQLAALAGSVNTNNTNNNNTATNNNNIKFVGITTVGVPPKMLLPNIEYIRYRIHDFANRREKRGEYVETKGIIAHGYPWKLRVLPRGRTYSIIIC
jgi:hypothetical protein